jgi:hypothetical protein
MFFLKKKKKEEKAMNSSVREKRKDYENMPRLK